MSKHVTHAATNGNESSLGQRLLRDQRGAGLVEYIMLAGLVAIAAITAFTGFGTSVSSKITGQAGRVTTITQ